MPKHGNQCSCCHRRNLTEKAHRIRIEGYLLSFNADGSFNLVVEIKNVTVDDAIWAIRPTLVHSVVIAFQNV